jgi:hypothetical protein
LNSEEVILSSPVQGSTIVERSSTGFKRMALVNVSKVNKALHPSLSVDKGLRKSSPSGHPLISFTPGTSLRGSPEIYLIMAFLHNLL